MNYKLINEWAPVITDIDLSVSTQEDINTISKLIATYSLVVIKKQKLSLSDELRVVNMFKDIGSFLEETDEQLKLLKVSGTNGKLLRVGGKKNEYGSPGISSHPEEMDWHLDFHWAMNSNNVALIWLHGVEGVEGSRTSWLNSINAYEDLDKDLKDLLKDTTATMARYVQFNVKNFIEDENQNRWAPGEEFKGYQRNVIDVSPAGKKHLFFPFYNMHHLNDLSKEESKPIFLQLAKHMTQEKYCYHHDWELGDIVISDNRLGLHKRWAFDKIEDRLLHRAMFDYPNDLEF
jgi:alpha-ketoglutarate-dependent taurine dioxygenase